MKRICQLGLYILILTTGCTQKIAIEKLLVEYMNEPMGLDEANPGFSWQLRALTDQKRIVQTAFQLEVKDETGNQVWDSGKKISDKSLNIIYQGKKLQPETRYNWTVKVWDGEGKEYAAVSWFETGLMNPDPNLEAWEGATWIGGADEDRVLYSQALTVFKVNYDLKLDESSNTTRASFLLGANDRRLMDKNLNILGVENRKDESYMAFELDISSLKRGGLAKLNIYRKGYSEKDGHQRIYSFGIPKNIINWSNRYEWHEVYMEMNFGTCMVYIGGREEENLVIEEPEYLSPIADVRGISLNPLGDGGGDLIAYPALADIGFHIDKGKKAFFRDLAVTNLRSPSNALFSEKLYAGYAGIFSAFDQVNIDSGAYVISGTKEYNVIVADPGKNAMPMLRTEFPLTKNVKKVRLYVTARGIYEVWLNGVRVGQDYFNPGLTQYNKTHMYQTYDVTAMLRKGENAIGALLGEGWWSGNITYRGYNWNYFGDRQSLLVKLKITYEDGSSEVITSNPEQWKYFNDGPVIYSSFFQGEIYDARKEQQIAGWTKASFHETGWSQAETVPLNEQTAYLDEVLNYKEQQLIGQVGKNATIVKTLSAKSVQEVKPGVFVYDLGQNMVGVPSIRLAGSTGDTITLRYAEMKYPDLPQHKGDEGSIMMENIRAALTTDKWILKGGGETIQPRFTFHGFRYLELTGIKEALPLEAVKGLVISSIDELASSYETSNELVNQLWQNITWSLRGNFLSIPTDTPARNERMGWNGDINVFSRTATFLADVAPFLRRHLLANRELQSPAGRFPDIAPIGTGFGGTLWGSAGMIIPWELYQQYGDLGVLQEHYPAMKKYVDFLAAKQHPESGILNEGPLGDWLSPEGFKNDNSLLWNAYQVRNLEILWKAADLLGKEEDKEYYQSACQDRKVFFNKTYVDEQTGKTIHSGYNGFSFAPAPEGFSIQKGDFVDTQASYAIPLAFDVFNEKNKERAQRHLVHAVERANEDNLGVLRPPVSLMTGFIGTAALNQALSDAGRSDLAYKLLQQTSYPSWLYSVKNGATTIWERLNSYTVEDGFGGNNSMNSFNHYSFGSVGAWMYAYSLGIQRKEPGFKSFILRPIPDPSGQMTWATGYYYSMYGKIASAWRMRGDTVSYQVSIPANSSATLELPVPEGKMVSNSDGLNPLENTRGLVRYELGSGDYEFIVHVK